MSQELTQQASEKRRRLEYATAIQKLYYRHASTLFAQHRRWLHEEKYYFIELHLNMAYVSTAFIMRLADPPYFLGTMVRTSLLHPDLFQCRCPDGHLAFAYAYSGSPLSGRIKQGMACPECGWNEWIDRTGWLTRSKALRKELARDQEYLARLKEKDPGFRPGDFRDLLAELGVPEEERELPVIENVIRKTDTGGVIFETDPYGGVRIHDTNHGKITCSEWTGIDE